MASLDALSLLLGNQLFLQVGSQLGDDAGDLCPTAPVTNEVIFYPSNYREVFANEAFLACNCQQRHRRRVSDAPGVGHRFVCGFCAGQAALPGQDGDLYVILAMTMFPQIAVLTGLYAIITNLGIQAIPSMIMTYLLFSLTLYCLGVDGILP